MGQFWAIFRPRLTTCSYVQWLTRDYILMYQKIHMHICSRDVVLCYIMLSALNSVEPKYRNVFVYSVCQNVSISSPCLMYLMFLVFF